VPTIGKLNYKLIATTGQFQKGMRRARNQIKQFGRAIKDMSFGLLNFRTAIAAVVGSAGIGLLVKRSVEFGNKLNQQARKLGTTAAALQTMRFAASQSGVEVRTMDMALQRMTRRLAEAAVGTGEAKAALKELGIDAKSLAKQGLDKQFETVVQSLERVEESSQKVRLGFKLFDSEGVAAILVSSKALRDARKDTLRFGTALSDIDANKLERTRSAVGRMQEAFKGIGLTLAVQLQPAIEALANTIANMSYSTRAWASTFQGAFVKTTVFVAALADTLREVELLWLKLKRGIGIGTPKTTKNLSMNMGVHDRWSLFTRDDGTQIAIPPTRGLFEGPGGMKVPKPAEDINKLIEKLEKRPRFSDELLKNLRVALAEMDKFQMKLTNALTTPVKDVASVMGAVAGGRGGLRTAGALGLSGVGTGSKFMGLQQRVVTLLERIERKTGSRGLR
jgi:hypothetical protein